MTAGSGGPVACSGDECNITCGVDAAPAEKNGCKGGITCTAKDKCFVDCLGEGSCQKGIDVATDGGARVQCLAVDACKGTRIDVQARDASIVCSGDDSCEPIINCADAGACAFDCPVMNDKAMSVCCPDAGCAGDSGACTMRKFECK